MTGEARGGWRSDPYQRHELRYWDGLAWTAKVSDMGTVSDDPVFPLPDDLRNYLVPVPPRRRLPGLNRAAVWAVSGFLGVIALAVASSVEGLVPASPAPRMNAVPAAAEQAPAVPRPGAAAAGSGPLRTTGAVLRADARTALELLPTRPATGAALPASRQSPRPAWADQDGAGCDARQKILRRDLVQIQIGPGGCIVRSGILQDPLTGGTVQYVRRPGQRSPVVLERVVSESDAWNTGAAHLTAKRRLSLANDPLNLLAVSAGGRKRALLTGRTTNDAATWLPADRRAQCSFVARRIAVKVRYRLWVTSPERATMLAVLRTCPGQLLPAPDDGTNVNGAATRATRTADGSASAPRPDGGRKAADR